jgi:large subunit ribosomal protein L24
MMRGVAKHVTRKLQPEPIKKWNILKGDLVEIISGKDKGKQGVVLNILRDKNSVLVEQRNLCRKRVKGTPEKKGGVVLKPAPIHYSNVNLVDPSTGKPCRIMNRYLEDGNKVRVSKDSQQIIPKPEYARKNERSSIVSEKNTSIEDAFQVTYVGGA